MPLFENILIGLDNTEFDRTVIKYTNFISELCGAKKATFFNANIDLRMERLLHKLVCFPDTYRNEVFISNMLKMVQRHFSPEEEMQIDLINLNNENTRSIIEYIDENNVDLLILGKKKNAESFSSFASTLARKALCSILLVPEKASPKISKIIVPVDFSKNSAEALNVALNFDKVIDKLEINVNEDVKVNVNHVYAPPPGELVDAMTNEQLKNELFELVDKELDDEYRNFMKLINGFETEIERYFTPNINFTGAEITLGLAKKICCDLIVCGATGKGNFDRILMGSFAEKLIQYNDSIPMLVVK